MRSGHCSGRKLCMHGESSEGQSTFVRPSQYSSIALDEVAIHAQLDTLFGPL